MSFLYPNMLFFLFALAIPVLIHLFNFRKRKVVYFSNTAILKNIEQDTAKAKKLKYLIVLAARMLFIAGLVLAFAYPYKKGSTMDTENAENLVAVYVDNSMSMQSQSSEVSLIEDARASARRLVGSLNPSQRFVLITNSREMNDEHPMNRDEMLTRIDEMNAEAGPMSLGDVYSNLSMIKKQNGFKSASLFVYSDFQKSMMRLDEIEADSSIRIMAFPLKSDFQDNIYIDSVWLRSPILQAGLANEVEIRVVNDGEKELKGLPVNFEIDGRAVAFTTVDLVAGGSVETSMQFALDNVGDLKGKVYVDDYPITFDNSYNFILKARPVIKIVEIMPEDAGSPLETLFAGDSLFEYQAMNQYKADNERLMSCQMLVVNEMSDLNATMQQNVLDFVSEGGSAVVFPSKMSGAEGNALIFGSLGIAVGNEADTTASHIDAMAERHSFFDNIFVKVPDDVDLPMAHRHHPLKMNAYSKAVPLMELQNGDPFMLYAPYGKGSVFVFASSLDKQESNLADHALFVPLFYKMAFIGGQMSKMAYTLGVDNNVNISDLDILANDEVTVRDENRTYETTPVIDLRGNRATMQLYDALPFAGYYEISVNGEKSGLLAWNDSRLESEMKFADTKEISEIMNENGLNVVSVLDAKDIHSDDIMEAIVRKSMLWRFLIVVSLVAMLAEVCVLRFWKN